MKSKRQNELIFLFGSLYIAIILFIFFAPNEASNTYFWNYIIDGLLGITCILLYGYYAIKKKYDLFAPVTIFSLIYVILFFYTPMYDIVLHEYYWFGVDLFAYGIKGSIIAFIGYLSFLIAYNTPSHLKTRRIFTEKDEKSIPAIIVMYIICFMANMYYLVIVSGNSVAYILSLGILGGGNVREATDASLGFISMLSFALPSVTLLYIEYGKSKTLRAAMFLAMFILQIARGFRFYIIQIVVMFAAYYYIRNNKKPKIRQILILTIALMIPIVIMTMFRSSIRVGKGIDVSLININSVIKAMDEAIWDNFRIYKTYYGIIKAVPKMTGYMLGKQMIIYTLVMFIPRMIWPGKPLPPGGTAIALGISNYSVMAGTAYPCIGEYYYEFGIVGVIICSLLFGSWMKHIYIKYRIHRKTNIDLMVYCTLLGTILQLVIRGYTPSNFWMIVFTLIPYVGLQILIKD